MFFKNKANSKSLKLFKMRGKNSFPCRSHFSKHLFNARIRLFFSLERYMIRNILSDYLPWNGSGRLPPKITPEDRLDLCGHYHNCRKVIITRSIHSDYLATI